jgi:hypothetical protein
MQDTIKQKNPVHRDTIQQSVYPDSGQHTLSRDNTLVQGIIVALKKEPNTFKDTTVSQTPASVPALPFYLPANQTGKSDSPSFSQFPFVFTEMNRRLSEESRSALISKLKDGTEIPAGKYDSDWLLPLCLLSAVVYAVLRATSSGIFHGLLRFITFRGINESSSRVTGELFRWQSTLLNLVSFINLSLFAYFTLIKFDIHIQGINGALVWLLCLAIIIIATTIRHFICITIGKASGEDEIFREYLVGVYDAYRTAGLIVFLLILLILYTHLTSVTIFFNTGFLLIGFLYVARVLRLFLIFINRHVSIFYLILYLCALEILPVLILVKYVTGLV